MKYIQTTLPLCRDGSNNNTFPPSWYWCRASGYEGNRCITYCLECYDGGKSSESGEELSFVMVLKTTQSDFGDLGTGFSYEERKRFFIANDGNAYRSWKGKLTGRPVFNLKDSVVYKYVRPKNTMKK